MNYTYKVLGMAGTESFENFFSLTKKEIWFI